MRSLYTFGDSILDCAHYNAALVDPAGLLVGNRDDLFPEFKGRDLSTILDEPVRLVRRAEDGARISDLPRQARDLSPGPSSLALVTVGGNDLIATLLDDDGPGFDAFERDLVAFLEALPIRPVLLGTVYDPSFGDNRAAAGILGGDLDRARRNFDRMNALLSGIAPRYGLLADLHAHFLRGRPDWLVRTIEPSLRGASEVRRVFLEAFERLV